MAGRIYAKDLNPGNPPKVADPDGAWTVTALLEKAQVRVNTSNTPMTSLQAQNLARALQWAERVNNMYAHHKGSI